MDDTHHQTPTGLALPPEIPYPPAPWHANAQLWLGLFQADTPAVLPAGLAPLIGTRARVIALVRYLEGSTLVYDELLIGTPAHAGIRPGVYVEYLYVNSVASLWGGRRLWGLPKELARFTWEGEECFVTDSAGDLLVTLRVNRSHVALPPLPAAVVGIGQLHNSWAFITAPMWARFGRPGLRVIAWSARYPYSIEDRPRFALAAKSARVTFPPPTLVSRS
jgi:Acetoacetate decarboxylase (ADC)